MHSECRHSHLKIGFIGFAKYGYGVMRGITKSGHHNINNLYYLKIEDYLENDTKARQVHETNLNNFRENLIAVEPERGQYFDKHYLGIDAFLKEITSPQEEGILIISLNKERGINVLNKIKDKINRPIWIFSSISKLTVKEIQDIAGEHCRVLRYLENMGVKVGQGITAVYVSPNCKKEGKIIFQKVFQGLGKSYFVKEEKHIDAARIITGSTIGIIAYLAQHISEALKGLDIKGLGDTTDSAAEIIYHSMAGALALGKNKDKNIWSDITKDIFVTPSPDGKSGTTEAIIKEMTDYKIPEAIKNSFKSVIEKYEKGELEE